MDINEICKIGKITPNDENIAIINNLKDYITQWLQSDKFNHVILPHENITYKDLPYPPLIDPDIINYDTSDIKVCWTLNIPLPPFYDFMMFGTHGVGFAAIPKLLKLCGCASVGRDGEKESYRLYESLFEQLVKQNAYKMGGDNKSIVLYICDFAADEDNEKLYSLIPSKNTLHIVRDPISILKALCNLQSKKEEGDQKDDFSELDQDNKQVQKMQRTGKKTLAYTLDKDPKEILSNKVRYRIGANKDAYSDHPSPSACDFWLREIYQGFHDGLLARMLIRAKNIRVMQTSDFAGKNAIHTLKALSAEFGFNEPKDEDKELFEARVSDLKCFIPAPILLNQDSIQSKDGKVQMLSYDDILVLELTTKFAYNRNDFTINSFSLPHPFIVQVKSINDIDKINRSGIAPQLQEYVSRLANSILEQDKVESAKKLTEDDILEYLSTNKQTAMMLDGLLVQHLRPLKETNKDYILSSWKYYQKFTELMKKHYENEETRYRLCRKNDDKSYVFAKFNKIDLEKKENIK